MSMEMELVVGIERKKVLSFVRHLYPVGSWFGDDQTKKSSVYETYKDDFSYEIYFRKPGDDYLALLRIISIDTLDYYIKTRNVTY